MKKEAVIEAAGAGAVIAAGIMAWMQGSYAAGLDEAPMPTQFAQKRLGQSETLAPFVGAAVMIVAGAVWGALYALAVPKRSVKSGLLFSILPTFGVWLVNYPLIDQPIFGGGKLKPLLLPALMNATWGAYVGAKSKP